MRSDDHWKGKGIHYRMHPENIGCLLAARPDVCVLEVYHRRLILYGCGDFIDDYEGISGHDGFRDDLVLMYFATVDAGRGCLIGLRMIPMQVRKFRLGSITRHDAKSLRDMLNRLGKTFGSQVEMTRDALSLSS
jgi:poly-gamma-glutamate capsule biosynthesis protein CapA/YwtB (metallophosphatase superfamily)